MGHAETKVDPTRFLPAELGYRMPAEWAPHAGTWLAWPHQRSDWPGRFGPIRWVVVDIIAKLARTEFVNLLVQDEAARLDAQRRLERADVPADRVHFWPFPTDRGWLRDAGPIFVVHPTAGKGFLDWRFNAWAKYDNWQNDDLIPARIAQVFPQYPRWLPTCKGKRVVLEGGSIDVDGDGTLLTTEECLLSNHQERNPGMTRTDYEQVFADYLGIKKVLWLGRGIVGDDTHGHVDDLARFVAPGRVVTVVEDNPADDNYRVLAENRERLRGMTDALGRKLEVIDLPMPAPIIFEKQRLPASYANFYIANDQVLVPTFNDPADRRALGILADLFPDRTVVGIHALDYVWGLGTLHCLSQQEPA